MNPSVAPDPRFRAWLAERAPRVAPPGLLARSMSAAAAVPQGRTWTTRWPLLRFAAPAAATVVLVAAVGAGILLSHVPNVLVGPSPSPSGSPAATADSVPSPMASPDGPPASATPGPATSPIPSPSPAVVFEQWTRFDMPDPAPDGFGGATPAGVVRHADRYVAVGLLVTTRSPDGPAVVWTSSDGITWELHDEVPGLTAVAFTDLVTDGNRILAFGIAGEANACCIARPAAWQSTDGIRWSSIDGPVPSVAEVGPDGFVGATMDDHRVRFVTSPDGGSWDDASGTFDGEVAGFASGRAGEWLAVGHVTVESQDDNSTTDMVVWRSRDGSSWDDPVRVAVDALPRAVVAVPAGFIIVGQEHARQPDGSIRNTPRIWRLDGTGLEPLPVPFDDGQFVDHIVGLDPTLVASGSEIVDGVANLAVWTSSDGGGSWARVPPQGAFAGVNNAVTGIATTTDGLVAVGRRWDPESGHAVPTAWVAAR
jgi:hypothetical protein